MCNRDGRLRNGCNVVTSAQGDPRSRDRRIASINGQGNLTLIRAAAAAGVEHFIFISALKADEGAVSVPQLAHKYAAEQALIASGMTYTIFRPSSFQEIFGDTFAPFKRLIEQRGVAITLGAGKSKHSFVAVRDVAHAVRLALHYAEAQNAIIPIGGPEDLNYREAYARIAQITGRHIMIMSISHIALRVGGAVMKPFLPDLHSWFALFALYERIGYTCETPAWLVEALGRRGTFDEAVRRMYQPQLVVADEERAPAGD
jgi:NADH dehydrogenase